jgi:glycosyltransferase involved in cell wall biosynthesis
MNPSVSVILPVYNRRATLEVAARSVLNQSFTDLELIIVDDASSEDLRPVVGAFKDARVVYVRLEQNGGPSVARNAGLQAARGAFIAFQDSDDYWLPWKLKMQMDLMAELPSEFGVVVHSKIIYGLSGTKSLYGSGCGHVALLPPPATILKSDEDQVRKFLVENRISLQNALFRRECYPTLTWFDANLRANEDWAFSSSLAQHTRIYESPEPVVLAFMSDDSISRNRKQKAIGLIRILKRHRKLFDTYPLEYAWNLWRIGRMLMAVGHRRMGGRFCRGALLRRPQIIKLILKQKLA